METATTIRCDECLRWFDLSDEDEANEFYYGHDCEVDYEVSGCALCDITEIHEHSADEYGEFSESFFEAQEMRSIR